MKILFTVDTYNPHMDGIQFVTSYLAEGLAQKGHVVDVITRAYLDLTSIQEETIANVHVKRINSKNLNKETIRDLQKYILDIARKYDVIINVGVQSFFTDLILPILPQIKVPVLLHLHSMFNFTWNKSDFSSIKGIIRKIYHTCKSGFYFYKNKKYFSLYTKVIQLHKESYGYRFFEKMLGINSIVLENAVEDQFFLRGEQTKKNQVVYVANFLKDKDQIRSVDLFMKTQLHDQWSLILIGSKKSSYYKKLMAYCEKNYASNLGHNLDIKVGISRKELCDIVKESSIFLMTSKVETFPISLIESIAAGVPFVSSDVGIVKYIPGGIIAHNDKEFIEALNILAQDSSYREELGEKGNKAALKQYCIEKKVNEMEKIIEEVIMENTRQ